jgi:hypothetical protein
MKAIKPFYFDEIQRKAKSRWEQLESDPELAAPWHQLFKQVQSPRHVISELLQNADDAEATEVSIKITDGIFTFVHNGRDFSADDFASMCRFGYSNKRLLRTIGFRGIGFKSTFSMGDIVGLRTPTLTVVFHKKRFTLPVWFDSQTTRDKSTQIIVKIADEQRQKELSNNIQEWLNSPFSLLFFNHIRRLKLGDQDLHWKNLGIGPIPNSEWMGLQGQETPYLVVRSLDEPFPEDALKEIRDERLLDIAENTSLPPCKVEIVLGAPGHLFVVLPTGVKTPLPFAMNAPFVQDPARLKIKDPEISPTNRWLLQRIGQLAADSTLQWLQREDLNTNERAKAYDLLPASSQIDDSLESVCSQVVGEASIKTIQGEAFVLTNDGSLEMTNRCHTVPPALWEIWTSEQIISILSAKIQIPRLLSNEVSQSNQEKLQDHNAALSVRSDDFLNILVMHKPLQPKTWSALLTLWEMASQWNNYYWKSKELNLYPVRGKSVLYSEKEVVRLGEKKILQSEDDWDFLANHLLVVDVNWLRYLTEQRRIAVETNEKELAEKIDTADRFLQKTNLHEPSNLDIIIDQVAKDFFSQHNLGLEDCVHFTQIAAKLNAKVGNTFHYWTRDSVLRPITDNLLFDKTGGLEKFLPIKHREYLLLHKKYSQDFISCSKDDWLNWLNSGNAGIKTFIPVMSTQKYVWGRSQIEDEVKARGYLGSFAYHYTSSNFEVEDWDFPKDYWDYWVASAQEDATVWGDLIEKILQQPKAWEYAKSAHVNHIAKNRSYRTISNSPIVPNWILKFRELRCLRDTRGNYHRPSELMRRTPQTEPLLDVEPFVDAHLDFEAARPLLDLLGVRNTPTGPRQILERLRALAKAPKPPILELTKWYQRLDALYDDCSTEDQLEIKSIFQKERMIFTEDGTWQTAGSAFITANENDAPSSALILSLASQLSIWRKIGVNEHPTVELTIEWIKGLPSGEKLPPADTRRIKALLGRHPTRIWLECRHWLNLAGEWIPIEDFQFSLSMQSLIRWTNFHDWVKEKTADLQMLSADLVREQPFAGWPSLASQVEKRIEKPQNLGRPIALDWIQTLGRLLIRIRFDDETETARIRALAARLAETDGQQVETISVIPYLGGKPAGLPEDENLAWMDRIIYITDIPKPRLVRQISETISSSFDWLELKSILSYSFERSEKDIYAYLNENFTLDPEEVFLPIQNPNEETEPAIEITSPAHAKLRNEPVLEDIPEPNNIYESGNNIEGGKQEIPNVPPHPTEEVVVPPDEPRSTQPPRQPQIKSPLIERFALANEYHKNGSNNFIHNNGNILMKGEGIFPWLIQEPTGTVFRYYWIKEHCLQTKPLELPTEIWHLIEQDAQHHALVLEDANGNPTEMHGIELLKNKEIGVLKLFPATYRLALALED